MTELALHPGVGMSGWDAALAPRLLDQAAALGYTHVVVPLRGFEDLDRDAIAREFSKRDLRPICAGNQQPHADISSDDPDVSQAGQARLRSMIRFTRDIGGDQLGGVIYGVLGKAEAPVGLRRFTTTASLLGELAETAGAEAGVRLVCEVVNRYESAMLNTAEQGVAFIKASSSTLLSLHLDSFHMNIEESDLSEAVRTALPYLAYVEIGQSNRGRLDQGSLDLPAFLDVVFEAGYRGRIGVEAFSASVLEADVASALAIWRDQFGAANTIAADAAALVAEASARAARSSPSRVC